MGLTLRSVLTALISLVSLSQGISLTGPRTLLVLEDDVKTQFQTLISDLEARGFTTTTHTPKSTTLSLFQHEERVYDNIIIFPTKLKGLGPNLPSSSFLKHATAGGNILILLPSSEDDNVPAAIAELATQVDIFLPPKGFAVVNHFDLADQIEPEHNTLLVDLPSFQSDTKNYFNSGEDKAAKLLYRGAGLALGSSPLVQPILKAPRFAYSYDTKEASSFADDENVFSAGKQLALVAGVQTRNNARITFVGGADLLADKSFTKIARTNQMSGNRAFAKDVTAWTFKETGVLRVDGIEHWGEEFGQGVVNGDVYRIKHDVTFSIALSEYSYDHFQPFVAPADDAVQLEFTMLDPYYRIPLSASSSPLIQHKNSTTYSTTFKTPDQHGVFTFAVNYKRPFLSNVHEKRAVTVRHFAHNEWTRSWGISGSWPWIAGIWVVVVGWIGFVGLWLWSKPVVAEGKGKKKQ
ncbi:oligosaccharyl transferase glycoprotein complex, beta subunit [Orbilia oligospora]|uniref:Dolichyl-diphosphooligosaccharide--protein glycosyltransferase subunit WBP1 n=1 Tax=Orbilia oligospora TaxID=2813651 RepID=A0A6G1MKD4_ORBOL|nr:oligosaccharyl transferase glycoprotein complex, beta subunit [Orbilia oligospora]KAF3196340.1 oligosaccharyl transferase glycoprotein complex, beta subunit [Orbilia oligospora]KAF3197320.1 oligosaccharyl transferase glycoprotein complex, beta subunit [Orbilia oligospora]KAF3226004.1 oligosaccharyl transferase glycoprotein complex, beta subunit [Orbilia oligospora]KAF3259723.1 oligosaccharyl transferase glycoprotein complex, beta subunit [Orbilia oligospora]